MSRWDGNKVQLGARVPQEVRDLAVEQAAAAGCSLNMYMERLIRNATADVLAPQDSLFAGAEVGEQALVTFPDSGPSADATPKTFDPECRNRTYHFTNSPGRPCRFCGGEI